MKSTSFAFESLFSISMQVLVLTLAIMFGKGAILWSIFVILAGLYLNREMETPFGQVRRIFGKSGPPAWNKATCNWYGEILYKAGCNSMVLSVILFLGIYAAIFAIMGIGVAMWKLRRFVWTADDINWEALEVKKKRG